MEEKINAFNAFRRNNIEIARSAGFGFAMTLFLFVLYYRFEDLVYIMLGGIALIYSLVLSKGYAKREKKEFAHETLLMQLKDRVITEEEYDAKTKELFERNI